jgi:hypothetical protein
MKILEKLNVEEIRTFSGTFPGIIFQNEGEPENRNLRV